MKLYNNNNVNSENVIIIRCVYNQFLNIINSLSCILKKIAVTTNIFIVKIITYPIYKGYLLKTL